MSGERGYLQAISCNISLSSCRVRAESIARALNGRWWWTRPGIVLDRPKGAYNGLLANTSNQATSCTTMTNVINKPPHTMEVFKSADGYEIGHCWVNDLPPLEEDESYNTPPCSSPPSPADNDIIVNPPTALPFCAFLRDPHSDSKGKSQSANGSIFSDDAKLREKLQKYADSLLLAEDVAETFYDATDDTKNDDAICKGDNCIKCVAQEFCDEEEEFLHNQNDNQTPQNSPIDGLNSFVTQACEHNSLGGKTLTENVIQSNEPTFSKSDIAIKIHPPTQKTKEYPASLPNFETEHNSKNLLVDRRLREVQELEAEERPKLLRSTSLKTGKTPPGSPNRKKIVRFADVLGLDLEAVRHIVCDDLPNVPSSAFSDLILPPEKDEPVVNITAERIIIWGANLNTSPTALSCLYPLFTTPTIDYHFLERVRREWVCLESATTSVLSVHCVCRIFNVSYEKHVTARYTTDNWCSWDEVLASYVPFSSDGEFDKFSFSLYFQPGTKEEQLLCFAIRYATSKGVRWDNNKGDNYKLRYTGSEDKTDILHPSNDVLDPWLHHFC